MRCATVFPDVKYDVVSVGGGGGEDWKDEYEVGGGTFVPGPVPCDCVVTWGEPRKMVDGSDGQRVCVFVFVLGVSKCKIGVAPLESFKR